MKTLKPTGALIYVEDIITSLSIEERAKAAGFIAIVDDENRPRATQGKCIAVGEDPLIQELIKVGDVVFFGYLAGKRIFYHEREIRVLEYNEIIGVEHDDASDSSSAVQ